MTTTTTRRWNGWGLESVSYPLDRRPGFWPFLAARIGALPERPAPPVALESIALRPVRLDEDTLGRLRALCGDDAVATDRRARVTHALGMSYPDLVRLRRGEISAPPDAVVYPARATQVAGVLQLAVERRIVVVPFGGGTSVVGGVEPEEPPGTHGVIALDLQRLDRVLAVDPVSHTAIVEAGIYGPALEQALNAQGYTLGHFPQSFEFSTVGGWIAARSAGQKSSRYGKIENMVVALELVTPQGLASTAGVPASAAGPSLKQLYIGSEGTLGVIVQATLRIHPLPEAESHAGILFKTFADGTEAVRAIAQSELRPIMLRLTDEDETAASSAMRRLPPSRLKQLIEQAGLAAVRPLGYALEQGSLLLASFEGSRAMVARERREALAICRRHGGFGLGAGPVHSWARERFTTPYLRDTLLDHGLLVETMETATLWDTLPALHRALKTAIAETIEQGGVRGLVMAHISHVYPEGASLYFTFLAPQAAGAELAQWQAIKRAALDAIVSHGGTISHHHGVGRDHRAWLGREIGAQGLAALRALKRELDPNGVMNPGKLGL